MRYRERAAVLGMIAWAGCTVGLEGSGDDGLTDQQRLARMKWQQDALPALRLSCLGCHAGAQPMIGFLAGNDDLAMRDTLMKYDPPVVNLEATTSSRLLTKNAHAGPALTSAQTATLLAWLKAESDATSRDPAVAQLATPAAMVELCTSGAPESPTCPTNHVSLAAVPGAGPSIPGAELAFTAYGLSNTLYLTNFKIHGGTAGTYLEHLLVVSVPTDKAQSPVPDQIDRYFAMKLNVKANEVVQIDGGTAVFGGFASANLIAFHFKALTPFKPDATGPMMQTGCRVLAKFKSNAVTPLTAPQAIKTPPTTITASCASCHAGGDLTAKGAMDLTGVNAASDAMVQLACNQVRTRVNLTNTDQSGFYLAPDPNNTTTHPIKLTAAAFTSFKASMDVWAKAEQTAPQGVP